MSNVTGKIGEDYAEKFLKKKKYKILGRNYRIRYGEIDIIAQTGNFLVFVEVKTRDEKSWYNPIEAVNYRKRQKIIDTAKHYYASNPSNLQVRFDIISIITKNEKPTQIEHLENAFWI